jgi:hypothetical protein
VINNLQPYPAYKDSKRIRDNHLVPEVEEPEPLDVGEAVGEDEAEGESADPDALAGEAIV